MDLIGVDVTDMPDTRPRRGDYVTLIGADLGVDELAAAMGPSATRFSPAWAGAITGFGRTDRSERAGAPRAISSAILEHVPAKRAPVLRKGMLDMRWSAMTIRRASSDLGLGFHGQARAQFRLPELRRGHRRWQGKCDACGEWNTHRRGKRRFGHRRRSAAGRRARAACSHSSRWPARRTRPRGSPPASPSSTASPAAALSAARCCWSAAIRASASRRC